MDRALVLKLLGKKDSVDLDDMVYNLREITEELSESIVLGLAIKDEAINDTLRRLNVIYNVLILIKENFKDGENVQGYTNSKIHMGEFVNALCVNTKGLINALEPFENKAFIYHTNIIIDLVLDY